MTGRFLQLSRRTTEIELSRTTAEAFTHTRHALGWTQAQVADRAEVSRSLVAKIESARRSVSQASVAAVADALALRVEMDFASLHRDHRLPRDGVHARCCLHVERRLVALGWTVAREVPVGGPTPRGWIDLLAFHSASGALIVIEVKTEIDDLGGIERRLSWYERVAAEAARVLGWRPNSVSSALLCLDTGDVAAALNTVRAFVADAFPVGRDKLEAWLQAPGTMPLGGRAIARIDPARRGRSWLSAARSGGRRRPPAYVDYRDAASRLAPRRRETTAPVTARDKGASSRARSGH